VKRAVAMSARRLCMKRREQKIFKNVSIAGQRSPCLSGVANHGTDLWSVRNMNYERIGRWSAEK
jgi:hypothetical protein